MNILIVDDDSITRSTLKEVLTPYGTCDLCVNGKEAVQAFHYAFETSSPYDLIILDVIMPEMNGIEALEEIRRVERVNNVGSTDRAKIIMYTTEDDLETVTTAWHKLGADCYLNKPIDREVLLDNMRNIGAI